MTPKPTLPAEEFKARSASARRTALVVGAIALAVYVGFVLFVVVAK